MSLQLQILLVVVMLLAMWLYEVVRESRSREHRPAQEPVESQKLTYEQRLRLWETDYGREADWILERWGEPLALLTEPRYEEMFWYSYRLTPLTQDAEVLAEINTATFWNEMKGLIWRNRELGLIAPNAFPGGFCLPTTGRVSMRGMYVVIAPPTVADKVVLAQRKSSRAAKQHNP